MICVPAEIEINEASILAQMDRVKDAQDKLENEMSKLRRMFYGVEVKEKGIPKNPHNFNLDSKESWDLKLDFIEKLVVIFLKDIG